MQEVLQSRFQLEQKDKAYASFFRHVYRIRILIVGFFVKMHTFVANFQQTL